MEVDQMELTTKQVAEAFGVSPVTVNSWVQDGRLTGRLPLRSRRLGRRFRIGIIRAFAAAMDDGGYATERLEHWLTQNHATIISQQLNMHGGSTLLTVQA